MNLRQVMRSMCVVCATALVVAAMAQGGPGGQGRGMRGGFNMQDRSGVMLLGRTDVQRDLALTTEQRDKLQAMQDEMRSKMREMFQGGGGGGADTQDAMRTLMESTQKEVAAILTPAQMKRLGEIRIQLMGARAAMDPEVQKSLGVTADQKTRLDRLMTGMQEANAAVRARMQNGDLSREEGMASMTRNTEVLNAEIAKVLTEEQNAKLKEMGGKKFEAEEQPQGGMRRRDG